MAPNEKLMGVADVAGELGLTEGDVRQWARNDGEVARIGTTWVFREDDVARLAEDLDDCYEANPDDDDDDQADDDEDDDPEDEDDDDDEDE